MSQVDHACGEARAGVPHTFSAGLEEADPQTFFMFVCLTKCSVGGEAWAPELQKSGLSRARILKESPAVLRGRQKRSLVPAVRCSPGSKDPRRVPPAVLGGMGVSNTIGDS